MSIIYKQIKNVGLNANLKVSLGSNDGFTGYQQEIDRLTSFTSTDLVNPVVDEEKRRFKLTPTLTTQTFNFYFYDNSSSDWELSFGAAGFTNEEIQGFAPCMLNSFFILDFYDSFDTYTQKKIFSTYLTKLVTPDAWILLPNYKPTYTNNSNYKNQFYHWYVPVSYLNEHTGTTITGYTKFTFINAKSGTTSIFYNKANESLKTPQKMYFESVLNKNNWTWYIKSPANAYELTISSEYNQRINDTYAKTDSMQQVYPTGNTYNYQTNKYYETE